jgi:hypothetical protein
MTQEHRLLMKNGGDTARQREDLCRKFEMTCIKLRQFRRCNYHTVKYYEAWNPSKYLKTGSYLTENALHIHYKDKTDNSAYEINAVVKVQEF